MLAAAKRLALPQDLTVAGALTAEALQRARRQCQTDWAGMTVEQRAPFKVLYENRLLQRKAAAAREASRSVAEDAVQPAGRSHWHCGSKSLIVHPRFVQAALTESRALPKVEEVHNTTEFSIQAPEAAPLIGEGVVLESCPVLGRNLCKDHADKASVTALHTLMKSLCDRLGKQVANGGDILVLFEGMEAKPPLDFEVDRHLALLSSVTWSPRFCDWTMCMAQPPASVSPAALSFPLVVDLELVPLSAVLPAPAAEARSSFHHETSEDLALKLQGRASKWRLRLCKYDLVSPTRMLVTGLEPAGEFDLQVDLAPQRPARRQRFASGLAGDLAMVLALNAELRQSASTSRLPSNSPASAQLAAGQRPAPRGQAAIAGDRLAREPVSARAPDEEDVFGSDDDLQQEAGLPGEEEDDCLADLLESQRGMDQGLLQLAAGLLMPEVDRGDIMSADVADDTEDRLPDAHVAAGTDATPAVGESAAQSSPDMVAADNLGEAMDNLEAIVEMTAKLACDTGEEQGENPPSGAASSSSGGVDVAGAGVGAPIVAAEAAPPPAPAINVGDPIPDGPAGWTMTRLGYIFDSDHRQRGRITAWGRNVSVKCSMHGCSKAKGRDKVSNGALARWLAGGVSNPDGSLTTRQLRLRHESAFTF